MSRTDGLRIGEIRAVFRLLNEIQEMWDDPHRWQEHMILRLCRLLGARQGAAIRWADFSATGALRLLDFAFAGWPGARQPQAMVLWQQALGDGGFRRDELLDCCMHVTKPLATLVRQDVMTDRQWHARDELLRTWAEMMEVDPT